MEYFETMILGYMDQGGTTPRFNSIQTDCLTEGLSV